MTVAEMIKGLKLFDPEAVVFMAGDSEGNHFDFVEEMFDGDAYEYNGVTREVFNGAVTLWPADARHQIEHLETGDVTP